MWRELEPGDVLIWPHRDGPDGVYLVLERPIVDANTLVRLRLLGLIDGQVWEDHRYNERIHDTIAVERAP